MPRRLLLRDISGAVSRRIIARGRQLDPCYGQDGFPFSSLRTFSSVQRHLPAQLVSDSSTTTDSLATSTRLLVIPLRSCAIYSPPQCSSLLSAKSTGGSYTYLRPLGKSCRNCPSGNCTTYVARKSSLRGIIAALWHSHERQLY